MFLPTKLRGAALKWRTGPELTFNAHVSTPTVLTPTTANNGLALVASFNHDVGRTAGSGNKVTGVSPITDYHIDSGMEKT
jgi:hypothetical protein